MKISVSLTLIGEKFDPALVTRLIGIYPDSVQENGNIPSGDTTCDHCEWGLVSGWQIGNDIDAIMRALFLRVAGRCEALTQAAEAVHAEWHCLIGLFAYEPNELAHLSFSEETVSFLGSIRACWGFDQYYCF